MYVMCYMGPERQALTGGIFPTISKIFGAVGVGITGSIYTATSTGAAALQTDIRPYRMVFWFCVASTCVGLLFVPFLTVGTQGHNVKDSAVASLGGESRSKAMHVDEIPVPNYNEKAE
jgi:hypothetical protein